MMSNLKYTQDHEWLSIEGDIVTVGITDHAQESLGNIVFVELPEKGFELAAGDEAVVIESVKAAGEINAPLAGTVIEVNEGLSDAPELINDDPEGNGWLFKLHVDGNIDVSEFLDQDGYETLLKDS